MFNKESMTQKSGDNSNNYQAETINIKQGVDCKEVIAIFNSLMPRHLEKLTGIALEEARHLFEQFKTELLEKLDQRYFPKFQLPAVQFSLFEAQREYTKCGDPQTQEQILSFFIDRIKSDEHSLKQITYDDAIATIPRLPEGFIDLLSLFAIQSLSLPFRDDTVPDFFSDAQKIFSTFSLPKINPRVVVTHLVSCGCAISMGSAFTVEHRWGRVLSNTSSGIFSKGFTRLDAMQVLGGKTHLDNRLFCPYWQESSKFQFSVMNDATLKEVLSDLGASELYPSASKLLKETTMSPAEIEKLLKEKSPSAESPLKALEAPFYQNLNLTVKGLVIGLHNYINKTSGDVDFDSVFEEK